ncbi:EFR1 family ferrodoxin [Fusobacterium mortiferum]|jgi:formate hydrogenlyase subunit 6/NADH:ubiquinone oxidoreductase subunit I|uniref:4Fe-4S ferredoxin-type domain-containing protein n=1 Tax=Fusobacterium mortiferum TaxID=850 RepID=A0ABS2G3R2_FUSMR|nr:EFR1 family ferrodoxin [Fusobacterium mortiferum]MBM6875380.1 hypothetical protein [Fusobacterium mortiferum]
MEIYYFSGTGNSLYIAKRVKKYIDNSVLIPIENVSQLNEIKPLSSEVGFIFPVYFGDIPKIVESTIKKFNFSTVNYIFVIPNCYSIFGKTFLTFEKLLKSKNKNISYRNVLFMPDNAILFPIEKDQEKLEEIEKTILPILNDIKNRIITPNTPTTYTQILQTFFMKLFSEWEFSPKKFKVNNNCIGCGICKQVCPCKNIELNNKRPLFGSNCTHCLSCFHWCPKEAISMKNFTIKNRRKYHNPNIVLDEIIRN